eukprot:GGOE01019003.1.p1 GENE.GGOE01019003.1~~GGOE01019003.1.p1  ORF type:complete len:334 (-),score=51.12 GGOE01019003.1:224-1225(-)
MHSCSNASDCAGIYWRSCSSNLSAPITQMAMRGPSVNKLSPEEELLLVNRLHTESVRGIKERRAKLRDKWRSQLQLVKECRWPPSPSRRKPETAVAEPVKEGCVVKLRELVQRLHPQQGTAEDTTRGARSDETQYSQIRDPHLQNFWRRQRVLLRAERSFFADALLGRLPSPPEPNPTRMPLPSAAKHCPGRQASAQRKKKKGRRADLPEFSNIQPVEASWDKPSPKATTHKPPTSARSSPPMSCPPDALSLVQQMQDTNETRASQLVHKAVASEWMSGEGLKGASSGHGWSGSEGQDGDASPTLAYPPTPRHSNKTSDQRKESIADHPRILV